MEIEKEKNNNSDANTQEEKKSNGNSTDEQKKSEKEDETKNPEENNVKEKINSVPIMMRCFLCEDYCEEPVQILCCNEIFCKKHITEEIMKNFACPNCHKECGLNNIIDNKKLSDDIRWFKNILNELVMGENERNHNH